MSRIFSTMHNGTQEHPPGGDPAAILIRMPNWLGDLLMATGFVRAVRHRFPSARVDLIVRAGFEVLPLPHRGRVWPYDKRLLGSGAFGAGLRDQGFTHFFVLPPSLSSAWMAWRSRIPWRIGYTGEGRGVLLRPARRHESPPRSVHLVQEYLDLLRPWMTARTGDFPAGLEPPPGWMQTHQPESVRQGPPYVVLAPGAEFGPAKQWPPGHYRATAEALANAGWRVVVAGLPKDRELGAEITAGIPGALNLCGDTHLPALTALLHGARLVISNDSGAMHLAAAAGVPQIALFGSTNPVWTAPLNPRATLLTRGEACSPCYQRVCPLGHRRCLNDLAPELVLAKALELLA